MQNSVSPNIRSGGQNTMSNDSAGGKDNLKKSFVFEKKKPKKTLSTFNLLNNQIKQTESD